MLSDKQNTYCCLHTNTTDTKVKKKNITTKPTKTTARWINTDISNKKRDHASEDGNSLTISQLHHLDKQIKAKLIKENQSREICDKTKELKNVKQKNVKN